MTYDTLEKLVNDSLEMQVNSLGDIPETLKKAMLYSLEAGGKRLRPVLLLAACGLRLVLWFKERKALLGQRLFAATEQRTLFGKTFLMILLFILSFIHVGFYATILVYFAVFPLLLEGVKNVRPAALAAYAGGLALTCWVIFRCFKIYLPEPLLF